MHKRAHRSEAAPAIHAVPRVAVKPAAGARAQLTLDIVREMLLRPPVIIGATGLAHQLSPRGPGLGLPSSR